MSTPTSSNNLSAAPSSAVKIGRPQDVRSLGVKPEAPTASNPLHQGTVVDENIGTSSQVGPITIKPVDRKTIEGSTPGDHRTQPGDVAKAAVDKIANRQGIRSQMAGQQNSRFYDENGKGSQLSDSAVDSDAGN